MKVIGHSQIEDTDAADLDAIEITAVLDSLADPVRLGIVRQLAGCGAGEELSCGQLEVPVSKSTATHHLKSLHAAGITAERAEGTRKYLSLRRAELDRRFPGLIDSVLRGAGA